jgi:hypothetical protein
MTRQYTLWDAAFFSTIIAQLRLQSLSLSTSAHPLHSNPHAHNADSTPKLRLKLPTKLLKPKEEEEEEEERKKVVVGGTRYIT